MVCMDGFVLTHASERADIPAQEQVDAFLPPYEPRQALDPDDPVSIGAMVGPEAFTEVRYLAVERMRQALEVIPAIAAAFADQFGRESGGLVRPYRLEDAEVVIVGLGSVLGTVKDTIDELRADGIRAGGARHHQLPPVSGRGGARGPGRRLPPAPRDRPRAGARAGQRRHRHRGRAGRARRRGRPGPDRADAMISTVIAGLGGRPVTRKSLRAMLLDARSGELPPFSFLDLQSGLVDAELARMSATPRSGPTAENLLRDLGVAASGTAG